MVYPVVNTYRSIHGLSCVENHVLAILERNNFPIKYLFADSFISLNKLSDVFFLQELNYANFNGATRIQNMAKDLNVISMILYRNPAADFATPLNKSNSYILILVQPEYAKETFQIRGWHEKHFVLLIQEEDRLFLLNDIPFVKQEVTLKQVPDLYAGEYFRIEIHKNEFLSATVSLEKKVPLLTLSDLQYKDLCSDKMIQFRDLVGVYRVLLRRQKVFCQFKIETDLFDKYIKEADAIYMRTEYLILKHAICAKEMADLWKELKKGETIIQKRLLKEGVCVVAD